MSKSQVSAKYRSSGPDKTAKADRSSGITVDPGPYVGTVIEHVTGNRMGQLKVLIADQAPAFSSPVTVSYASPFYGKTYGTDTGDLPDTAMTAGQSYGMWMVPPDIGCSVLITFAGGDIGSGYWFACVYDSFSHHMVPANARNIGGKDNTVVPKEFPGDMTSLDSNLPVIEFSVTEDNAFMADAAVKTPRYIHEYQSALLVRQGLDRDQVRGAISSSSLRETPSNVYGISTPGRKLGDGNQFNPDPKKQGRIEDYVAARQGGHSFVMDDGDKNGTDQLVRLRTTSGHQVLMNDTENVLYIASASGLQWLEFSPTGQINVYGRNGINFRTEGAMNFHSDAAILMETPIFKVNAAGGKNAPIGAISLASTGMIDIGAIGAVKIVGDVSLSLSTSGFGSLSASTKLNISALGRVSIDSAGVVALNCGLPIPGFPALPAKQESHQDTVLVGNQWVSVPSALNSVCTVVPAHEPWTQADYKTRPGARAIPVPAADTTDTSAASTNTNAGTGVNFVVGGGGGDSTTPTVSTTPALTVEQQKQNAVDTWLNSPANDAARNAATQKLLETTGAYAIVSPAPEGTSGLAWTGQTPPQSVVDAALATYNADIAAIKASVPASVTAPFDTTGVVSAATTGGSTVASLSNTPVTQTAAPTVIETIPGPTGTVTVYSDGSTTFSAG